MLELRSTYLLLSLPKSNAKLEKMEKFQKEVDEYPEKKSKAISDA